MRAQRRSRTFVYTVSPASNNFNPRAWLHLEEDEEEEREAAVSADKAECGPEEIQCSKGKWRPCFTVMETRTAVTVVEDDNDNYCVGRTIL